MQVMSSSYVISLVSKGGKRLDTPFNALGRFYNEICKGNFFATKWLCPCPRFFAHRCENKIITIRSIFGGWFSSLHLSSLPPKCYYNIGTIIQIDALKLEGLRKLIYFNFS